MVSNVLYSCGVAARPQRNDHLTLWARPGRKLCTDLNVVRTAVRGRCGVESVDHPLRLLRPRTPFDHGPRSITADTPTDGRIRAGTNIAFPTVTST